MGNSLVIRIALFSAVLCLAAATVQADDAKLLSWIPGDANTIAVIDVTKLLKSPLGMRENWKENLKNAYASGPVMVPPNASRLILASMINPSNLQPAWEVSVIELTSTPSMKKIARAEGGYVDNIAEMPAAWSPINAYFLRLDSKMIGTVSPANRQFASRWAKRGTARSESEGVSPFLRHAVTSMGSDACYMFAMDVEDATCAHKVRRRIELGDFECLNGESIDAKKLSPVIASIKGVTLSITVDDNITGTGIVEFSKPVAAIADIAKPLLIEMLDKSGAGISDFDKWKVTAKDNKIILSGKLSIDGMRQLLSIVQPPNPQAADEPEADTGNNNEPNNSGVDEAKMGKASKAYYTAIAGIIEGVGRQLRDSSSLKTGSAYVGRDARRINRLPILNVDPDLIAWGTDVSQQINEIATVAGVGGLKTRARTVGIEDPYKMGNGYDWDNEVESNPNDKIARDNAKRQRLAASAEEKAQLAQTAADTLLNIEASRAKIRAAMTQKYNIEF